MPKKNRVYGGRQKSLVLRIVVIAVAVLLLVGLIVPSMLVFAAGEDLVIQSFETGKLSDALTAAADGTDFNQIQKVAVLGGTLSRDDYAALMSLPNITYLELAGADTENGAIPEGALQGRNQLAYVSLPKNTTLIGDRAFSNNKKLEKISMPYSVASIGNYAFDGCIALYDIPVSENIVYIGEGAFRDCSSITEFVLPSKITVINDNTFGKCGFSEFFIGPSVISIGSGAFADCNNLKNIYVYGNYLPSVGADAFRNVSATVHISVDVVAGASDWSRGNLRLEDDLTGEYTLTAITEEQDVYAESSAEDASATPAADETAKTDVTAKASSDAVIIEKLPGAAGVGVVWVVIAAVIFYALGAASAWIFFVKKNMLKHPLLRESDEQ
jgi:hypothetical protein